MRIDRRARVWGPLSVVAVVAVVVFGSAPAWGSTGWHLQKVSRPGTSSDLLAVSCPGAAGAGQVCEAVGTFSSSKYFQGTTLAEVWDGTSWHVQPSARPPGTTAESSLDGVSCLSIHKCEAVGAFFSNPISGAPKTLAEGWDGMAWTRQTSANPGRFNGSSLDAVSCSARTCIAVGSYTSGSTALTLAETWNGTAWVVQKTPNPAGATSSSLTGISCSAATSCIAIGSYTAASGDVLTLAERWHGSKWTLSITPNPSGSMISSLSGVSCATSTACTAVGSSGVLGATAPLVEEWNGTTWTVQTTPTLSGSAGLSAVSCPRVSSACTAVGQIATSDTTYGNLAEFWNGSTWTVQKTPNPAGSILNLPSGISCTSGQTCTMAGDVENSKAVLKAQALAEG
jgi:hypothetical protein